MIDSGNISCCGASIHYERYGAGKKRVLLLHGWGCDISAMQGVCNGLMDRMQVLCVDLPGHGQSGRPPEPWGVPQYAAAVRELLGQLDFAPCDVVAHSFGARIAIWLAAEESALFRRLVLTGAAGLKSQPGAALSRRGRRYARVKGLAGVLRRVPFLRKPADALQEWGVQRYGSEDYRRLDPEMRKTFNEVLSLDLGSCLGRIAAPTLLIWGDQDTATPLWMGQRMEKEIPDAGLVVFEGRGHFAYAEEPDRFLIIVRHFLLEG